MALDATREESRAGDGVWVDVSFPHLFFDSADLVVTSTTSGVTTTLTEGVDYTVAGAGVQAGGTVTMTVAPAVGTTITVARTVAFTQPTSFRNAGTFSPGSHENAIDRAVMMAQQIDARLDDVEAELAGGSSDAASGIDASISPTVTTAVGTYATLATVTFWQAVANQPIVIIATGSLYSTIGSTGANIRVTYDGVAQNVYPVILNVGLEHQQFAFVWHFTGAATAGDKTVLLEWARRTGTGTLTMDSDDSYQFLVM